MQLFVFPGSALPNRFRGAAGTADAEHISFWFCRWVEPGPGPLPESRTDAPCQSGCFVFPGSRCQYAYAERLEPQVLNFVCLWLCRWVEPGPGSHPERMPSCGCGCLFSQDPRCQAAFAVRLEPQMRSTFLSGFAGGLNPARVPFRNPERMPRANPGVSFSKDPRCQSAYAERLEPRARNFSFPALPMS